MDYKAWEKAAAENPDYNIDCKHLVFVYGDAKKYFFRDYLLSKAKFIEPTTTAYKYFDLLVIEGRFPGMVYQDLNKNEGYQVAGELYEVNGRTLWKLENSSWDSQWYKRDTIVVNAKDDNGHLISCFVYLIDSKRKDLRLKDDKRNISLFNGIKKWDYPIGYGYVWYFDYH